MSRSLKELLVSIPQVGRLQWIGLRPAHRAPVRVVEEAELVARRGLAGDRAAQRTGAKRQVTLIQAEHLAVIASLCARDAVEPAWLRRNLVVEGINLLALRDQRFFIGEALLEGTGLCHPCARMEEILGPGGYNAMRGHGGLTARVLSGGKIRVGDHVRFCDSGA